MKGVHNSAKHPSGDRHSGAGVSGDPKKKGAGKGGWGTIDDQTPVVALDKNDPNYVEEEDTPVVIESKTATTKPTKPASK